MKEFIKNNVQSFNLNECTVAGNTALMIAASWDRREIVKELIRNGAIITLKNNDNYTAYDIAKHHRNFNICDIIKDAV